MKLNKHQKRLVFILAHLYGINSKAISSILQAFKNEQHLKVATIGALTAIGITSQLSEKIVSFVKNHTYDQLQKNLHKLSISYCDVTDSGYPPNLLSLKQPPYVLFYKGNIEILSQNSVAIVGTRKPSAYGKQVTENIVNVCVDADVVTVSGLAYGIDTVTHRQTLKRGGKTVAFLGHGLDTIQPQVNKQLGEQIVSSGVLVSEYPPGVPAWKQHFPARNRLIAGSSQAIVVVEGALKSGSLITAKFADKYKRTLFAVPGMISNPMSAGPHKLIEDGANILSTPEKVLNDIVEEKANQKITFKTLLNKVDNSDKRVEKLIRLLVKNPYSVDEISRLLKIPMSELSGILSILELESIIHVDQEMVRLDLIIE